MDDTSEEDPGIHGWTALTIHSAHSAGETDVSVSVFYGFL
jgi:hypothetical protein